MSAYLSQHFTIAEAARSQTAARLGLNNTPPAEVYPALKAVADTLLEPIRAHFGVPFSPSSWYRAPALEKVLCRRAFNSWCAARDIDHTFADNWQAYLARKSHPRGEAVDIELPGIPNHVVAKWISDNLKFDQLILEFHTIGEPHSGWVHVSAPITRQRGEVLTIGGHGTQLGLPTYA